jgi:hypothetical protein
MRIVQERIVPAGVGRLRSGEPGAEIRKDFERIGLYVPAKVIAAFISVNALAMRLDIQEHGSQLFLLPVWSALLCICGGVPREGPASQRVFFHLPLRR